MELHGQPRFPIFENSVRAISEGVVGLRCVASSDFRPRRDRGPRDEEWDAALAARHLWCQERFVGVVVLGYSFAVKPMLRVLGVGGFISSRMAERMAAIA